MSESFFFAIFYKNKTITNPVSKHEVFNCSDIFSDYKTCKSLSLKGKKDRVLCSEIRSFGRDCYLKTKEEFEKDLIRKFDEKKQYIQYLKEENSILYHIYLNDPTSFSVSQYHGGEAAEMSGTINAQIINK